jgi:hypothetical protein
MQLTDKNTNKTIEVSDHIASILLSNPQRWEVSIKKPLPKIEIVIEEIIKEEIAPKAKRGRKAKK